MQGHIHHTMSCQATDGYRTAVMSGQLVTTTQWLTPYITLCHVMATGQLWCLWTTGHTVTNTLHHTVSCHGYRTAVMSGQLVTQWLTPYITLCHVMATGQLWCLDNWSHSDSHHTVSCHCLAGCCFMLRSSTAVSSPQEFDSMTGFSFLVTNWKDRSQW